MIDAVRAAASRDIRRGVDVSELAHPNGLLLGLLREVADSDPAGRNGGPAERDDQRARGDDHRRARTSADESLHLEFLSSFASTGGRSRASLLHQRSPASAAPIRATAS